MFKNITESSIDYFHIIKAFESASLSFVFFIEQKLSCIYHMPTLVLYSITYDYHSLWRWHKHKKAGVILQSWSDL